MAAVDYPRPNTANLLSAFSKWKQANFEPMDLGVRKSLSIVTCMDSRLMPASMFGLQLGDAEFIRNAGGRVTPDVIRSLVVADELLHSKCIFVIHHTDCGGQAAVKHHDLLEKRENASAPYDAKPKMLPCKIGDPYCKQLPGTVADGLAMVKALGANLSDLGELYPIKPPDDEGLRKSVEEDIEKLKSSPYINPAIELHGFVYNTHTGDLEEVVKYIPQSTPAT